MHLKPLLSKKLNKGLKRKKKFILERNTLESEFELYAHFQPVLLFAQHPENLVHHLYKNQIVHYQLSDRLEYIYLIFLYQEVFSWNQSASQF